MSKKMRLTFVVFAFLVCLVVAPLLAFAEGGVGSSEQEMETIDAAVSEGIPLSEASNGGGENAGLKNSDSENLSSEDISSYKEPNSIAVENDDSMAPVVVDLAPGDNVYVNGKTGDDSNPGTEEAPVKTFAKAKELMVQYDSDIIWVTGALQVNGTTETWDLGGKMIMRDGLYNGDLVQVTNKGKLTLENIVLDGGCKNGATGIASEGDGGGGSLVAVRGGNNDAVNDRSTLTIGEGAILRNNVIRLANKTDGSLPESGGGVFAAYGNVNVEGGTITGNTAVYGGGICGVYNAKVTMSSGEISGNSAIKGNNGLVGSSGTGTGGGVCVWRGATMDFSGGTISGNKAYNRGGGISVGGGNTFAYDNQTILTMTDGTISDNEAGAAGGGIFVQAGVAPDKGYGPATYCVAKITGGALSDNAMTNTGNSNSSFGGGAIYVNGINQDPFHNGELYLQKAVVTGNTASIAGAGYAGCPASNTEVYLTNGSVFYGNKTDNGNAREIYILASSAYGAHSGNPPYEISPSMLGGGAYKWMYDDGTEVPLNKLAGTLSAISQESLSLSNTLDDSSPAVQKALSLATVHITGNTSATRGGGIGTNGSVFIGKELETTEISVSKQWNDANNVDGKRPESVVVELYRDGEYVGYQTVKADDGNWTTTFENLPKADLDGKEYVYTVKERGVEGYSAAVTGNAADGFIVTNTRSTSVSVSKKWNDNNNVDGKRPSSVTVDLFCDGKKVDSASIEADENGDWSYVFEDLAKFDSTDGHELVYTVQENEVPNGYTSSIEGDVASGFVILNTKQETPPTPDSATPNPTPDSTTPEKAILAQTGDEVGFIGFAVFIALTSAVGLMCFACRRME